MYFSSLISNMKVTCFRIICFIFYFLQVPCFSVLKLWHTYTDSHPNRGATWTHNLLKKRSCFDKKNVLFKLNSQDEGHLDCNFFIFALTIHFKWFLLQFFSLGIQMHILILTGVQNGQISPYTYSYVVVYVCIFPSQKELKKDT